MERDTVLALAGVKTTGARPFLMLHSSGSPLVTLACCLGHQRNKCGELRGEDLVSNSRIDCLGQ